LIDTLFERVVSGIEINGKFSTIDSFLQVVSMFDSLKIEISHTGKGGTLTATRAAPCAAYAPPWPWLYSPTP
jgi:hypothetical protein